MNNMSIGEQRIDTRFRDRFTSKPHLAYAERRNFVIDTKVKYNGYEADGKSVFTVTLSTYVTSEKFAKSDRMRKFWIREFMHRLTEQLPYKLKKKVDFDYVIERSDDGHYHYHGLLAMPRDAGYRIWAKGMLNKDLDRDLTSLSTKGQYRDFAVNSFLIEPIRQDKSIGHWVHYMTKTQGYITSSAW